MKIEIFSPQHSRAKALFEETIHAVKALCIPCEVSWKSDAGQFFGTPERDCFEQDVYILDPTEKACTEAARLIREKNFISTILFVYDTARKVPNILRYRPSALISAVGCGASLKSALAWAYQEQCRAHPYFIVKNKEEVIRVRHADILWFESRQRIVVLHALHQEISFYAKLSEVCASIPSQQFLRCHQSYIVNMDYVQRLDKVQRRLYLTCGVSLEVSKSCYQDVLNRFGP